MHKLAGVAHTLKDPIRALVAFQRRVPNSIIFTRSQESKAAGCAGERAAPIGRADDPSRASTTSRSTSYVTSLGWHIPDDRR